MPEDKQDESLSRRGFLVSTASAAFLLALADEALAGKAAPKTPAKPPARPAPKPAVRPTAAKPTAPKAPPPAPVNVAIIGLGAQGRDLAASLSLVPGANITAICDTYAAFLRRGQEKAPKAAALSNYREVLSRRDVQAVFVATPTHKHKEIVLAALQAGKHVYCEAPIAHTMEDAREIARAAAASKQLFQAGQQLRANPQHHHVKDFVYSAVLGKITYGRAQWNKKTSWVRPAPTDARQREMNWRLDPAVSLGLVGEQGIHSMDVSNWFVRELPVAVSGFGAILHWSDDGRKVPDTVQCTLEYASGIRFNFAATLTNSFDGQYELFGGTDAAVLMRDQRAWLFKEADSPLLGWEVYARKEHIGDETGIALVADASKQLKEGKIPGKEKPTNDPGKNPLFFSCEAFLNCIRENKKPECGPLEGLQAVVTAQKANEAVLKGTRIAIQKDWFAL